MAKKLILVLLVDLMLAMLGMIGTRAASQEMEAHSQRRSAVLQAGASELIVDPPTSTPTGTPEPTVPPPTVPPPTVPPPTVPPPTVPPPTPTPFILRFVLIFRNASIRGSR